jgi:predicted component of type VI protein secretion system
MARLLVLRGENVEREVEVGRQTFRIGRGEQNDLVLEDPGKAVSRNHAEIRYENGRYVLTDRESQNGIWVSGARVPFVILDPKVVASVGPYRLMLEEEPATDAEFLMPAVAGPDSPTEFAEVVKTEVRIADPVARPKPKPSAPAPKAAKPPQKGASQSTWLLVGGAVVVVAIGAIAIARFVRAPSAPPTNGPRIEGLVADARKLIEQGDCARALKDAIDPALALDPNNSDALTLRTRASACIPPPPAPAPVAVAALTADEIAEHLRVANEAVARRECEAALTEHINKVLEQDPSNQQAVELKARAEICPPPPKAGPASPPATLKLAVRIPAEKGGLEPITGELDKDYQTRVRSMKERYDEAVAILASGAYPRAIAALEGIAHDGTSRYLDVASKLSEARKAAAAQANTEARDLEAKNEYDQAIQALRRAGALDRDARVDEDIKRVQEKKTQAGVKACDEAKNAYAFNRPQQALLLYQQVVRLLPADHACYATAKERIAALSK